MTKFFRGLYSMDYQANGLLSCHGKSFVIPNLDKDSLLLSASNKEIRRVVFSMAPLKAPRLMDSRLNFICLIGIVLVILFVRSFGKSYEETIRS